DTRLVAVAGVLCRLQQLGFRALVNRAECAAIVRIVRVTETQTDRRLIEQSQIEIAHVSRGLEQMWRDRIRNVRVRILRIQRISQQIVIEEILIATEVSLKVVESPFLDLQPSKVIGIAAIAEVGERQIVEQESGVVRGMHVERLLQQARTAIDVHIRTPNTGTATVIGNASAEFECLLYFVTAELRAFITSSGDVAGQIHAFARGIYSNTRSGLLLSRSGSTRRLL